MNQQRLQAYLNLIQQLLTCPNGEEWILLRQNEQLVTPELVQVMEQVVSHLAHQGNLKAAKVLHNLAGQIYHLFVAQTTQFPTDEDHTQAYQDFIKALLNCPQGSEDELLEANQTLIGPGLVHKIQQVAAQMAVNGDYDRTHALQQWATELSHLWLQRHNFQLPLKSESDQLPLKSKSDQLPLKSESDQLPLKSESDQLPLKSESDQLPLKSESDQLPLQPDLKTQPFHQSASPTPAHAFPVPTASASPAANQPHVPQFAQEDVWADSIESTPASPPPHQVSPPALVTPPPQQPDLAALPTDEQISHHLAAIAGTLNHLSETLARPPQPPTNPLWYMEILEQAQAGNWILTSHEIHQLIGVQPTCTNGSSSFQRGCWVFEKTGKLGSQLAWRVHKQP